MTQSELIRLYVNHRPALPLDKHYISAAFSVICDRWVHSIFFS